MERLREKYEKATKELEAKNRILDKMLALQTSGAVGGNYDSSAILAKKTADHLRYASLGCMMVISAVAGFALYETTQEDFLWVNSLFRLIFTVILSVPAVYLARESTRHRHQQTAHLQISLNLKTISPFISSLPEENQHKIKTKIALRLFMPSDTTLPESYPLITQDIAMKAFELMKKMDPGTKKEK